MPGAALCDTGEVSAPVAVAVAGLVKDYGSVRAVDGLDLTVALGEVVAVLGPNGAGKTTTLEVIEGLRRPDGGTVRVLGESPARARRRVGVQLQEGALYADLSCAETLGYFARCYGVEAEPGPLLELVGLAGLDERRTERLSGGQKRRLQIALALCNNPELVILDEPTTGLDPLSRRQTWELVRRLHADGRTILLTTHYIEEAEALADRVVIVDRGTVIDEGSPAGLVQGLGTVVTVSLTAPAAAGLDRLPGLVQAGHDGDRWRLRTKEAGPLLAALTDRLGPSGLRDVLVQGPTLEDVFLARTGRRIEGGDDVPDRAA